jgi:hypothetical protein
LLAAPATLSAGAIVSETAVTFLTTAAVATRPVQAILSLLVWTVMPLVAWPEAAAGPMVTPQRVMTTVLPAVNGAVAVVRMIELLPGALAVVPVAVAIVTVGTGGDEVKAVAMTNETTICLLATALSLSEAATVTETAETWRPRAPDATAVLAMSCVDETVTLTESVVGLPVATLLNVHDLAVVSHAVVVVVRTN